MTRWFSVRASQLHQRTLVCRDLAIQEATLFPFFDDQGATEHVLIVEARSSDLRTFRLHDSRVWIPGRGKVRLDVSIRPLEEHVVEQLAPLWHYDPWWLLTDERFASEAAVPILKQTNCVDRFEQEPADLVFSACLSGVRKVKFARPSEEYQTKLFCPDMLPPREFAQSEDRGATTPGWHLDPFW